MMERWEAEWFIAEVARKSGGNERAIRLAAQLAGYPPCPGCDYTVRGCRCANNAITRSMEVKD